MPFCHGEGSAVLDGSTREESHSGLLGDNGGQLGPSTTAIAQRTGDRNI